MIVTASTFDRRANAPTCRERSRETCAAAPGYRAIADAVAGVVQRRPQPDGATMRAGRMPAPARPRVVTGTEPYTLDVAVHGAAAHGGAAAARTRTPGSCRSTPPRRRRCRACSRSSPTGTPAGRSSRPPATRTGSTIPTTPACSTTCVRFRGQRVAAVVAESRARRRSGAAGADRRRVRGAAGRLRPGAGARARRAAGARRQGRRGADRRPGAQRRRRGARRRSATSRPGSPRPSRGGASCADAGTTPARPARAPGDARAVGWLDDDGRLGHAHQHPGAVPGPRRACARVRRSTARRVRVLHRPRRRRLRRQAGDAHRGPRRAGGAAHRPPGAVRVHPQPTSSPSRRAGTRCGSRSSWAPTPTAC